jgi:hypothetical protein
MKFLLKIITIVILTLMVNSSAFAQNAIFGGDFANGWSDSRPVDNGGQSICFDAGVEGTRLLVRNPSGDAGDKFFRFATCWDNNNDQFGPDSDGLIVNMGSKVTGYAKRNVNAFRVQNANPSYNYVFKTAAGGNPPSVLAFVVFEVQGDIRNITGLTRSSSVVSPKQDITLTATLNAALNTGQSVYLRYTNNNYSTSSVVEMTGSGTSYTATIPGSTNSNGVNILYYAFTSGSGLTIPHADADLFTINRITDAGFNYTVASSWTTTAAGDWSNAASWASGAVPVSNQPVTIAHDITMDTNPSVSSITIDGGATLSLSSNTLSIASNGIFTNNGSLNVGTGTVAFLGAGSVAGSTETTFNNVAIAGGVQLRSSSTISNKLTINSGGYLSQTAGGTGLINDSQIPSYSSGATLAFTGLFTLDSFASGFGTSEAKSPTNFSVEGTGAATFSIARTIRGTLSVASEASLTTNNNVTLASGGTLSNEGTITGNLTFNRNLVRTTQTVGEVEQYRGWRLLSSPAVVPFSTWLSGIWTQGGEGANFAGGTSNVFTSSQSVGTTLDRQNITDFTQNVQAGRGYAVYVYESDFNGGRNSWPKALTLSGAESAAPVSVEFVAIGESTLFALAGNPFSSTIQFDNLDLTTGSLKNSVWVYNPASDSYISRTNGSGDFNGLITPFQGFWVSYGEGENGTLTFPASAKTSGGTFYSKEVQRPRLVMDFTDGTFSNSAWVTFDQSASEGYDQMDADQFSGMSGVGAQFYTIVDNKPVDINFIPAEFDEIIEFPLGYYTSQGGTVSITVRELTLPENVTASIVNRSTGEAIKLDNDVVISFEAPVSKRNPAEDNKLTASVQASQFKIRFTPPTSTSTEIGTDLPVGVELSQNYPNPFNPATQIRFAVPVSGEVRLAVYDLLGREVAVLVNGGMSAGSHIVNFDAASLGSGVYVYRLDAAGQTLTRKMTLVK